MPIKISSAKAKGRNHQKFIRDRIIAVFQLEEGDAESRGMGGQGVDIMLSPKARRAFPVSVEAKKTKAVPSRAELKQSQDNAYPNTIGAVVWAPHGSGSDKSVIMFDFEEFLHWWKEHHDQD